MLKYILLVGGFVLLIKGADFFVDGSSALGHIKQIEINEESGCFYRTGKITFEPVQLTKTIQEKYNYNPLVA